MRINHAIRQALLKAVIQRGGIARTKDIERTLATRGFPEIGSNVRRYAQPLLDSGALLPAGHGIYATPEGLRSRSASIMAKIPFGTTLKGQILHYLISHRFATPRKIFASLSQRGNAKRIESVYTAAWQLTQAGYITTPSRAILTLTEKGLRAVGLRAPLDPTPFKGSLGIRSIPYIRDLLASHGEMRLIDISRALCAMGIDMDLHQVSSVLIRMRRMRPEPIVRRMRRGVYALADNYSTTPPSS